ncbi:T-complex protein 1 subunit theta [Camellia lanceoleosa]|uniref:T-complex protein 1 subunit theta n=1 Tax=Camellia lanceoleosa TaxID=1840588 RepID=A0ACC0IKG3_9ERIC|nr:T-complex protein 1 subunit theta [Camellia lanceoleosa]
MECGNSSLEHLSFPLGFFPKLRSLDIANFNILSIPNGHGISSTSLLHLQITDCNEIESFPEGGLPNLRVLQIWNCGKLPACRREWGLQRLPCLTHFTFEGGIYTEEGDDVLETFLEEGLLPPTLTSLSISDLQDLKSINYKSFQHLTCLKELRIDGCPQLQSLPEEGLLASLSRLYIYDCPLLKPCCERDRGDEWHKIAHIPFIRIDYEVICTPNSHILDRVNLTSGLAQNLRTNWHRLPCLLVVLIHLQLKQKGIVLIHSAEQLENYAKTKKPKLRSLSKQLQTQVPRLLLAERQLERWHCTSLKLGPPNPDDLGYIDSVSVEEIGGVRAMCRDSRIVFGAAAIEIELARRLKEFSFKEIGLDQCAIAKFAETFEMVPKTLAENAGLNAMEIISSLYGEHASGNTKVGIDLEEGACKDVSTMNIWDLHVTNSNHELVNVTFDGSKNNLNYSPNELINVPITSDFAGDQQLKPSNIA